MAKQHQIDYPGLKPRFFHSAATVGDSLFVWAGDQAGLPFKVHDYDGLRKFTNTIQQFTASTGQWFARKTTGTPPLGVIGYSCTAINDCLYYFGGYDYACFHNNITRLDTISLQWRELTSTDATIPVMRRTWGGMLSFEHDGVHNLLTIGGIGSKPAVQLPHYQYIDLNNGRWRTNEHSVYNLSSGKWGNVSIVGECIPPADGFIVEKINNTQAILFGGIVQNHKSKATASSNMYLLNIDLSLTTLSIVSWQCIKKPEAIDQWPVGRYNHAGAIIVTKFDCPLLVICGGMNNNNDTLDDCWIFDTAQRTWTTWTKVGIHHSFSKRWAHSLSVFTLSPRCFWIITVGGAFVSKREVNPDELVQYPCVTVMKSLVFNKEKIMVQDIPVSNNQQYQSTYCRQLQLGRTHWLEYQKQKEEVQILPSSTAQKLEKHQLAEYKTLLKQQELETQAIKQQLRNEQGHSRQLLTKMEKKETDHYLQLQQKEQEYHHQVQENKAEKELEIQRICFQLQEKLEREKAVKDLEIQNYHYQLQEKEQEMQKYYHHFDQLQEKEAEIERCHFQLEEQEREKAKIDQEIQNYRYQLQEKEKVESLKNQEIQRYLQQLQEKEDKIQNYFNQLQEYSRQLWEKEREKAEKDQEIQKYQYQLQEKEKTDALTKQEIQKYRQQLQEREQENFKKEKEKQKYYQKIQENEKEKTETKQRHSLQLSEKETEIQRCRQHLRKEEAEKEQYCHQLKENEKKYIQKLKVKDKELSEKQKYHVQLQENEAKLKQKIQNFDHELQKMKKELEDKENEMQKFKQQLQKEQGEKNQKIQQLLQQIQHNKNQLEANDSTIQFQKERTEEKIEGVKLLHSSQTMFDELKQLPIMPSKQNEQCDEEAAESVEDELKGVHVADQKSILIHGGSDELVNWEEYGIRIAIPEGAVLPSDTVQVTITALVGGDFVFPEDTELVSAVYAISLSKPFLEPVKLEMQHCVAIETASHCSYLSFSTSTNDQPPYQFNTVNSGKFSVGNRYGSISITTFSKYCINRYKTYSGRRYRPYLVPSSLYAEEQTISSTLSSPTPSLFEEPYSASHAVNEEFKFSSSSINNGLHSSSSSLSFEQHTSPPLTSSSSKSSQLVGTVRLEVTLPDEFPDKCYHGKVIYEVKRLGREWLMRFLLCKDLNALIMYIDKNYKISRNVEESTAVFFRFKNDNRFIELFFDDKQYPKGWSLRPHHIPTGVSQDIIDEYGSMSPPRFPECLITITATPGEDTVKELNYPVALQGIKKSHVEKINIVLTMGDIQQTPAGMIDSHSGPTLPDDRNVKPAEEVLRDHLDALSEILAAPSNLLAIITSLYSKKLITDETYMESMNAGRPILDRCASLLFALKSTVTTKPQSIITLIEILKRKEAFKEIAYKMDLEVSFHNYTSN